MPKVFYPIKCVICDKTFRPLSRSIKTCSDKCATKLEKKRTQLHNSKILSHFENVQNAPKLLKLVRSKKYKITDERTESNIDSPTGRVYIGVSKRPLQEVDKGYGYKGVLLQTDNRMFIQCHVCGKWFKKIIDKHLSKHQLDSKSYKKKFGLFKTTALVADATSYKLEANGRKAEKNIEHLRKFQAKATIAAAKARTGHGNKNTVEHENRYAICKAQLGFRIIEYMKKYHNLPSRSGKNDGSTIAKALFRRYGSLNEGFKHYGLPVIYRQGTNVEFAAPNNKQLFINYNKPHSKEDIWQFMLENCPVLQDTNQFKE